MCTACSLGALAGLLCGTPGTRISYIFVMVSGFPPACGGICKRVMLVLACLAGAGVDTSLPDALAYQVPLFGTSFTRIQHITRTYVVAGDGVYEIV